MRAVVLVGGYGTRLRPLTLSTPERALGELGRLRQPAAADTELADTLAVVADVESSGGATVFRVSESSVRRALDAGWSAADLHDFFGRASRTIAHSRRMLDSV